MMIITAGEKTLGLVGRDKENWGSNVCCREETVKGMRKIRWRKKEEEVWLR